MRRSIGGRTVALAASLLFALTALAAAEPPRRVVSLNLCLDQIALDLAAPGQLIGVSDLAHDPRLSPRWREARMVPAIGMHAETIVRLAPDLVLVDSFAPAGFKRLLRTARISVAEFEEASGVEATAIQMARIGQALGDAAAGAAMADRFRADMAGLARRPSAMAPLAAIFQANGMTLGRGTLSDDLLRRADWRNLAAERGLESFVALPLEAVVSARPDLLVLEGDTSERPSRAEGLMNHRALRAARSTATLAMPHHLWLCGGPQNVEALRRLVAARERIGR